jgi:transposase
LILIGIDAHEDTHTAAALDAATARPIEDKTVHAPQHGHFELGSRLDAQRIWVIEDCRNYSGTLEQWLLARGERVLRDPPKLSSSQRRTMRSFGKSDTIDATAAALAAIRVPGLPHAKATATCASCAYWLTTATTSSKTAPATTAACANSSTR